MNELLKPPRSYSAHGVHWNSPSSRQLTTEMGYVLRRPKLNIGPLGGSEDRPVTQMRRRYPQAPSIRGAALTDYLPLFDPEVQLSSMLPCLVSASS